MIEAAIGLVGVVVGSVITISRETWVSYRDRRRDSSYAAVRLICILEEYADSCIDVVQDDGTVYGQPAGRTSYGEVYLEARAKTPDPPKFPEDISWPSLDEELMHRVLALPNKARSTDRHIFVAADFASPPGFESFFIARREGYAHLGAESLMIARDLRVRYSIAAKSRIELGTDWSSEVYLDRIIAEFNEQRQKH